MAAAASIQGTALGTCKGHDGPGTRRISGVRCSNSRFAAPGNGRRRLERCPEGQGHPVGDAAQNAAAVIGCGSDRAAFHHKGVIISLPRSRAAPKPMNSMPLTAGCREDDGGNTALHAVKQRSAQSHGQTPAQHIPRCRRQRSHPPPWRRRSLPAYLPTASSTTGNGLSAVETVRGGHHRADGGDAADTPMPCFFSNCRQMPAMHRGCQPGTLPPPVKSA